MPTRSSFIVLTTCFVLSASLQLFAVEVGRQNVSFERQRDKWGLGFKGGVGAAALLPYTGIVAGFPDALPAITLHVPHTSFLFSTGIAGLGFGGYGINANVDFLLKALQATKWFELHIFLGAGGTFYGYRKGIGMSAGLRVPLGMSFWLWEWFQIYLNVTPIAGLGIGLGNPPRLWFHIDGPIDLGVRFWF